MVLELLSGHLILHAALHLDRKGQVLAVFSTAKDEDLNDEARGQHRGNCNLATVVDPELYLAGEALLHHEDLVID